MTEQEFQFRVFTVMKQNEERRWFQGLIDGLLIGKLASKSLLSIIHERFFFYLNAINICPRYHRTCAFRFFFLRIDQENCSTIQII